LFQALYQGTITGLLCAFVVLRIKFGQRVEIEIGLSRELEKKGKEEVAAILLIFVTKIAIKV